MPVFASLLRSSLRQGGHIGRRFLATEAVTDKISLTFASPNQVFYSNAQVLQVTAPTTDGEVGIFPTHVPLVGVLRPGVVSVQESQESAKHVFVSSGSLTVNDDSSVQILVEEACGIDQIDLNTCQRRLEESRNQLNEISSDERMHAEKMIEVEAYEALVRACQEAPKSAV